MTKHVEARTDHLRLAADRVRVLDMLAPEVRRTNLAVTHQLPQHAGDGRLPAVPANAVDAPVEGRVAPFYRVRCHGAGNQRRREDVLAAEYRGQGECRRHLGAVQQCESFFRRQPDRFDARVFERRFRGHESTVHSCLADADQHAGHVCERCKVARRANRSLGGNPRIDVVIDQCAERIDQFEPHARETFRERDDLHQHDQAHDVVAQVFADADRMRTHQVFLQLDQFVVADVHACELAEAGIDAVDLGAAPYHVADVLGRLRDRAARLDTERHVHVPAPGLAKFRERHQLLVDHQFHDSSPRPTIGSCRPCSFAQAIASG